MANLENLTAAAPRLVGRLKPSLELEDTGLVMDGEELGLENEGVKSDGCVVGDVVTTRLGTDEVMLMDGLAIGGVVLEDRGDTAVPSDPVEVR